MADLPREAAGRPSPPCLANSRRIRTARQARTRPTARTTARCSSFNHPHTDDEESHRNEHEARGTRLRNGEPAAQWSRRVTHELEEEATGRIGSKRRQEERACERR